MSRSIWTFLLLIFLLIPTRCSSEGPGVEDSLYDILIQGGTVVDGTGAPGFRADVAIRGNRIEKVDPNGITSKESRQVVRADDLVVAPGFIDNHAHIQLNIHEYPLAENFTRQGITTILASLHGGDQPWPLDQYMASLEVVPNVGFFAGHTWIRKQVIGGENRAPTQEETAEMKAFVEEAMRQGALGLSTGLNNPPASYATTEEVIELAKVAARYGGIYVSHIRDDATGLLDSVAELIRISEVAEIPAQIQHHKPRGEPQWGLSEKTLAMIDSARARGLDIKHDIFPYTRSRSRSEVLFPRWALAEGTDSLRAAMADPATLQKLRSEMQEIFVQGRTGDDISRIEFRILPADPSYQGKTLADLATDRGLAATVASGIELAMELQLEGGFEMICTSISEEDLIRLMRHPYSMVCTDGAPKGYGVGRLPHPRSYGTFPRILGRYVRQKGVLTLEEAVRRMTSLAADQIGQTQRGRIAEGMVADITVFDPETILDLATYQAPHQYSVGVWHVLVNGTLVMDKGALTGAKPGQVLKGPARPAG